MAVRSRTQICSLSIVGIAGSNPAEGMDVLLCLLCVVKVAASTTSSSLAHSLPSVRVFLCVLFVFVFVCVCLRATGVLNNEAVKARVRLLSHKEKKNEQRCTFSLCLGNLL